MATTAFDNLTSAATEQFKGIYTPEGIAAREAELLQYAKNIGLDPSVAQAAIDTALNRPTTVPTDLSSINTAFNNETAIKDTLTKLGDTKVTADEMLAFSNPTAYQLAQNALAARSNPNISVSNLATYGNALTLPTDVVEYLTGKDTILNTDPGVLAFAASQATAQEQALQTALGSLGYDATKLTPTQLASAADAFTYSPTKLTNFVLPAAGNEVPIGGMLYTGTKVTPPVTPPVTSTTTTNTGTKVTSPVTTTGTNLAGLSGLSALANTTQTQTQNQGTQQPSTGRVDFSKLPPQLRMAGQYADYLAMPTADKGPKLSTYRKVGDATTTGLAGAMPTYTMGRAPTPEEAFRNFIYAGGASDALASERILQYARNMGLTPEQTLSLTNNALRGTRVGFPDFTLADYDAAVAAGRGLLAIPEARTAPALSYASPGFTAPSQGGLSAAAAQGMSKGTFYGNINAALQNNLLGPQQVADAMRTYGITADDLIAARAMANTPTTGAATSSTTLPDSATVTERVREGGPIAFAEGDVVKAPVMAGEKAYTLADFGITPATVETARGLGAFTVPRNVLFNPELIKREAAYRKEKGLAGGGDVGRGLGSIAMKGYAQEMAQKGRFGDTMLAHISPEEAQMLQAAGGAGTINPQTGLPEYFSWRKLLKGVGKVLPFVLPFTGIGLGAQALISGLSGAVSGGKGFDFKRGLMSGLMSYGMGSLAQGAGAASGASEAATQNAITQAYGNAPPTLSDYANFTGINPADAVAQAPANVAGSAASQIPVAPAPKFGNVFESDKGFLSQLGENIQAVGRGGTEAAMGDRAAQEAFTAGQGSVFGKQLTPTMAAGATAVGMGGVKAADEMNQFELQQAMANARTEEERERFRQLFLRTLGPVGFAGGGDIAAMVAGGATGPANEPRTINGAGDGMSDSVPATIEGVQEARLADGEFVIPADVVADLGNGSSNAGSKKLYAMMDRVRKARHGTTRQPPEVDTGRLMPA